MSPVDDLAVALSTAIVPLPCEPEAAARLLSQLSAEQLQAFALDSRLTPADQLAWAQALQEQGAQIIELGHPQKSGQGLPAACPASTDRDERREARRQLIASLRLACDLGGLPLVLSPSWLRLSQGQDALAERFAWGLPLSLEALEEERAAVAPAAFDALCSTLDPVLNEAFGLGVSLLLPTPTPWPHQLPDPGEQERLAEIFAGAPLASYIFGDWQHVAEVLERRSVWLTEQNRSAPSSPSGIVVVGALAEGLLLDQEKETLAPALKPPSNAVPLIRLADACGLSTQLPLGSGELAWEASGLAKLAEGRRPVLCLGPGTSRAELLRSLAWLERLTR